jgi:hypothetical protein
MMFPSKPPIYKWCSIAAYMWWVYSKGTHSEMVLFQLFSGSYNSARYMAISKNIINIWLRNTHIYIISIILYYIYVRTPFTDTYIAYIIQYHTRNSLYTVYVQHSPSLASHGFPARPRDCLDWKISAMPLTSLTAIRCSERQGISSNSNKDDISHGLYIRGWHYIAVV